ncbi:MAG: nucleotide exchange factor GrpE [Clostridiales Family XIII bacterium]|jgi:molecular chaperone GrpE|nr:nucleotide exchange factor GrpE [Clostridiales Family XIII bacterium]
MSEKNVKKEKKEKRGKREAVHEPKGSAMADDAGLSDEHAKKVSPDGADPGVDADTVKDGASGTGADAANASAGQAPDGGAGKDGQGEDTGARYMRLVADFQNYKKRVEKEKSDVYAYANEKFAADLLDVLDNFERAIGQDTASGADGKFIEGMKLIMDQLVNILERNNVAEMDALGVDFDPVMHHAVQMEKSEEYESGKVTKVIQKGYMMRDKVLRPAMVMVAE